MADRLALAVGVRKARRHSVCSVCRRLIIRGDQIARLVNPSAWIHIGCVPAVARLQRGEWPSMMATANTVSNGRGVAHSDCAR